MAIRTAESPSLAPDSQNIASQPSVDVLQAAEEAKHAKGPRAEARALREYVADRATTGAYAVIASGAVFSRFTNSLFSALM